VKSKKHLLAILQNILQYVEEGIHVVDEDGTTIFYNQAMADLEGMQIEDVLGKRLLDVFSSLNEKTSTLLRVLNSGTAIIDETQSYLNNIGKQVTTVNTTIPLIYLNEKLGALEIAKNITKIKNLSDEILRLRQQLNTSSSTQSSSIRRYTFGDLHGKSQSFLNAVKVAKRAAASNSSVLIFGETGTGKELFAQSIHYQSNRLDKPFIAQNCAALPESLLEGILFGTTKGSFTGSVDRPGLFEQANGGTILLDEINSMGLLLQSKLLRVLQEGYIRRIGGLKDLPVDVRIIATTNEDPATAIKEGTLRRDLYYRLNVVNISIPSLRERKEDISMLSERFISEFNKQLAKEVWLLSTSVHKKFMDYSWPGNVRELRNVIEGAMNLIQEEHVLKEEHFPPHIMGCTSEELSRNTNISLKDYDSLRSLLEAVECSLIDEAMKKYNNNISHAAKELKISRQALQHKLRKLQ
jgi:arginine utilization regulatory protein